MMRTFHSPECERLVSDLLAHMSLPEKAGQLGVYQVKGKAGHSASDALVRELADGRVGTVRGITSLEQADALQQIATERSRLGIPLLFADETDTGFDTLLPTHFAAACSWDIDAIAEGEGMVADEAALHGLNWSLSPEIYFTDAAGPDVSKSLGNDIHLAAQIAAARVRGLQGAGAAQSGILATLDLAGLLLREQARERRKASDGLALASDLLRTGDLGVIAFDRLSGGARMAMDTAFAFLRGPGGFSGIILSEWERLAANAEGAVGGMTFEDLSVDALISAVQAGHIAKARLDDAVARILRAKYALGLFGRALGVDEPRGTRSGATTAAHRERAMVLARRSPVLLRNHPALLPLGPDAGDILVVGSAAGDRTSALAGRPGRAVSIIDGLEQLGVAHKYVAGLALRGEDTGLDSMVEADRIAIAMASEAARRSNTVVLVVGESGRPGELGEAQAALLQALYRANPRLVLVTTGTLPVDPWIGEGPLPCVLHAGQLGTMSGAAIAEVLTGASAPGGKLPLTMPDAGERPGLPFGYGLSYGEFELSDFAVPTYGREAMATARLHNVGRFTGTETVQLYLARDDDDGAEGRTASRLAAFRKVTLNPGESAEVQFTIDAPMIGRFDEDGRFAITPGNYRLAIGLNSAATLATRFEVTTELARALAGLSPTVTPFRRRA